MQERKLSELLKLFVPYYKNSYIVLLLVSIAIAVFVYLENKIIYYFINVFNAFETTCKDLEFFSFLGLCGEFSMTVPLVILLGFVLAFMMKMSLEFYSEYLSAKVSAQTTTDIENAVMRNIFLKDETFFKNNPINIITPALAKDITRLIDVRMKLFQALQDGLFILVNILFFVSYDLVLTLILITAVILAFIVSKFVLAPIKTIDKDYMQNEDTVKSAYEEYLVSSSEIQTNNYQDAILKRLSDLQEKRDKAYLKSSIQIQKSVISNKAVFLLTFLILLIMITYLIFKAENENTLYLGLIPVIAMVVPKIFSKISNLVAVKTLYDFSKTSTNRIQKYISSAPSLLQEEAVHANSDKSLLLKELSFFYDNGYGFEDINVDFKENSLTCITGVSGSGKSSLVNLIINRIHPIKGKRIYNQRDYLSLNINDYISYMPQAISLFKGSIKDNISITNTSNKLLNQKNLDIFEKTNFFELCIKSAMSVYPDKVLHLKAELETALLDIQRKFLLEDSDLVTKLFQTKSVFEHISTSLIPQNISLINELNAPLKILLKKYPDIRNILFDIGVQNLIANQKLLEATSSYEKFNLLSGKSLTKEAYLLRKKLIGKLSKKTKFTYDICMVALTSQRYESTDVLAKINEIKTHTNFIKDLEKISHDICDSFETDDFNNSLTWLENLTLSSSVNNASQLSYIYETINNNQDLKEFFLLEGLKFNVGNKGINLAGSERQLIVFLRSILRNKPLLILDDPTSILDKQLRKKLVLFLHALKQDRIIIIVSEEDDLINISDQVIKIENFKLHTETKKKENNE